MSVVLAKTYPVSPEQAVKKLARLCLRWPHNSRSIADSPLVRNRVGISERGSFLETGRVNQCVEGRHSTNQDRPSELRRCSDGERRA